MAKGEVRYRLVADAKGVKQGVQAAGQEVERFARSASASLGPLGSALTALGPAGIAAGVALAGVTAGVVAAGYAVEKLAEGAVHAVQSFGEFQTSMGRIETLVGVNRDLVQKWGGEILDLAPQLGSAPKELSDALFVVTSAGERGAEAMDILTQAAKASKIGMGETKDIARVATGAIQAYGKENLSASRAIDVLTATVREGNLDAASLASTMGRVVPVAAEMGISMEEVGAFIATYTRVGVNAEEATTGLRNVMTSLLKPAADAEYVMANMGLSFEKVRARIKDVGLQQALEELFETIKKKGGDVSSIFPNVRGLVALLGTAGSQAEVYNQMMAESFSNVEGITDEAFSKVAGDVEFVRDQMASAMDSMEKSIGQAIATTPAFGEAMVGVRDAVLDLSKFVRENKDVIAEWSSKGLYLAVVGIGGTARAVGELVNAFNTLTLQVLDASLAVVNQTNVMVGGAQKLAEFAQAHPFIAEKAFGIRPETADAAVAALGKIRGEVETTYDELSGFRERLKGGNENLQETFEAIDDRLLNVAAHMKLASQQAEETGAAMSDVGTKGQEAGGGLASMGTQAETAAGSLQSLAGGTGGGVVGAMGKAKDSAKELENALANLEEGHIAFWDQVYENMGIIDREVNKIANDIDLGIDVDKLAMQEFGGISKQVLDDMRRRTEAAAEAAEEYRKKWTGIGAVFGEMTSLIGSMRGAITGLGGAFSESQAIMLDGLSGLTGAASAFTNALTQPPPLGWIGIAQAAISALAPLKNFLGGLVDTITGMLGGEWGHGSMGAKGSAIGTAGEIGSSGYGANGPPPPGAGAGPPKERPPGYPANLPWPPSYAGGTGGRFVDFGAGTLATLHGRERVMTEGEASGGTGGMASAPATPQVIDLTVPLHVDSDVLGRVNVRLLRDNAGQFRAELKDQLEGVV
jgi:TP901 family phage tail tape measure protein